MTTAATDKPTFLLPRSFLPPIQSMSYWWIIYALTLFYSIAIARCLIQRRQSRRLNSSSSATTTTAIDRSTLLSATSKSLNHTVASSSSSSMLSGIPSSLSTDGAPGKPFQIRYRYVVAPMGN
jgi:hypothetical protein